MNRFNQIKFLLVCCFIAGITLTFYTSCEDEVIQENMYTFKGKTLGQFLEENSEYSEFAEVLRQTHVMGLMEAYGEFTCFAPDNEAMYAYYKKKGKTSLADFTLDELKIIANDHIISGSTVTSVSFKAGRLPQLTMGNRYLSVSYSDNKVYINVTSLVLEKDILVHNGVIHKLAQTLDPTRFGVVEKISEDSTFSIFYEALVATGLSDSLMKQQDDSYDPNQYESLIVTKKTDGAWSYDEIPRTKRYGYTVFLESNQTMNDNGIFDMETLKVYAKQIYDQVYPEDKNITDITDRKNSLNRFVAYHLINKELSTQKLIDAYDIDHMIKTCDMYEYMETMCPNTLIEVKKDRKLGLTNMLNSIYSDEGVLQKVVNLTTNTDRDALNGVFHEVDKMLVYDIDVANDHSGKRLRFESASFFPELTNNNMRGTNKSSGPGTQNIHYQLPRGFLENLESSEQTVLGYLAPDDRYQNFQGDEIFIGVSAGKLYDFTLTTAPVPAGTYEVRIGYITNGKRGVVQFYVDGLPAGVPVNLNNYADNTAIGWIEPGKDPLDPDGFENDKMMRNQGYMKAPACFKVVNTAWSSGSDARHARVALRKILGIYEFKEAGHHKLTAKGLSSGEFMMDYMEFIPTSAIEMEDIY